MVVVYYVYDFDEMFGLFEYDLLLLVFIWMVLVWIFYVFYDIFVLWGLLLFVFGQFVGLCGLVQVK